jgi:hypothetical protein
MTLETVSNFMLFENYNISLRGILSTQAVFVLLARGKRLSLYFVLFHFDIGSCAATVESQPLL